ncbi:uncharacterized protein BX663DRAFT_546990 [Cokeromyces recurvatus]|uniref:uncharacterized protein n=1 Tax=Cokeromyces recurvatus TaxID=90255 RepID=UPI0022204954|nr:uncharacterized protein BX663DRAFT_546990 [Cokeromyces recurvatus]KAI7897649.1 hypothetical protein BX663DRAFT_546990 [Cokeromyces recurvatus]
MTKQSSLLLSLPKELLLEIIIHVASYQLLPTSLLELSQCCKHLYHLIHKDPWRQKKLWPCAFHYRFDTHAIYRRRLHYNYNWYTALQKRCKALQLCKLFASNTKRIDLLNSINWEVIWDMITEHDQYNIPHLLKYQVQLAAGAAFQLGPYRDRESYPVVLPILSLLVNYDFSITHFFQANNTIVSTELSQFAYNFEADALITQYTPLRDFHTSWSIPIDQQHTSSINITAFYPSQDPLSSAFHLFFVTLFAHHPQLYQAIPNCVPIPLFTLHSELFDVEFLRRYERNLFLVSLQRSKNGESSSMKKIHNSSTPLYNIYTDSGFASTSRFVSEAYLIEGEWVGYYTFQDPDDDSNMEDWFDGPMRMTIKVVPLEDQSGEPISQSSWLSRWLDHDQDSTVEPRKRRKTNNNNLASTIQNAVASPRPSREHQFPSKHLIACPLTRFEGTGIDNLGHFSITGLIDDTEEGQVTWEKNYIDSGETWEYTGRFIWPIGLSGRWGDEEYGGPWWMWKVSDNNSTTAAK